MQFQKIRYFIDNHFQLQVTYFIIMNVKTIYNIQLILDYYIYTTLFCGIPQFKKSVEMLYI